MKIIKKLVSVILAGLMLSNICVVNAAEGDEQIVSLQFAIDGTVTDTYNNTVTICDDDDSLFTTETMLTKEGQRVILTSRGAIEVDAQELLNSNEFTYETWININETKKTRRLFALVNTEDPDNEFTVAEVIHNYTSSTSTSVLKNRIGTKSDSDIDAERWIEHSTDDIYPYANTWKHYTFTRKWDSENSKWTTKTYIDGVLATSKEESGVRLSENNCKLYVGSDTSYMGGITKGLNCSYGAVNVYKKELSAERIAQLYNDSKDGFMELSDDMDILNITPAAGNVSLDTGLITLKFSNLIDPSTVSGNIIFSKENGGAVEGWSASVRDNFFIDVTIPKLQHREKYKLTVKPGLQSMNQVAATESEFVYTAKNESLIIDEDFSGANFVVGAVTPAIPGLEFRSGNTYTNNTKVGQTENGTKYLRVSPVELGKSEQINILFDGLSEGCPVIELKIRRGGDESLEPRMGMLNGVNGTYCAIIGKEYADADKDAEGFASYKIIICKSAKGFYQYELHYTVGGQEQIKVINFDAKEISSITKYNVVQFYLASGNISPENYIDISYIAHYILNEPKVAGGNLETFNIEADDTVTVTFNEKINEETITADTVKLINKETGNVIPWTFVSYNQGTKTASFKVNEYLEYDTEYEIDCFGTQTEEGIKNATSTTTTFETAPLDVTLSNVSYSYPNFSTTVNSVNASEVKIIAVLYDLNGRAVEVREDTANLSASGSDTLSVSMNYPSAAAGYKLKVIAVENDNGNLKPIKKAPLEYTLQ